MKSEVTSKNRGRRRIEGSHGARDIVGAHTKPKAAVEANTDWLEAVLTLVTGLVCSLKDSRINTVCDDPDLLCPIVVTVV